MPVEEPFRLNLATIMTCEEYQADNETNHECNNRVVDFLSTRRQRLTKDVYILTTISRYDWTERMYVFIEVRSTAHQVIKPSTSTDLELVARYMYVGDNPRASFASSYCQIARLMAVFECRHASEAYLNAAAANLFNPYEDKVSYNINMLQSSYINVSICKPC